MLGAGQSWHPSDREPKRITVCPGFLPSVSPDNQHVAYLSLEDLSLKIKDLASQTPFVE